MATTDLPIVPLDNVSYVYLCLPMFTYVYLCLPMFTYTTHDHLAMLTCEDIKGLVRRSLLKSGPLFNSTDYQK